MAKEMTAAEAREELQKSARLFRAFERIDQVLAVAAGMEQNEREISARLESLRKQTDDQNDKLQDVRALARDTVDGAKAEAEKIIEKARAEEQRVVDAARADSEAMIGKAVAEKAEAKKTVELARKTLSGIETDTASKRAELDDIESKLSAARAERDRLLKA